MPNSDPFSHTHETDHSSVKQRKLWRNLFLFSLCVTFLLIGIFWVPIKMIQMENFVSSPSVNVPKKVAIPISGNQNGDNIIAPVSQLSSLNLLETKLKVINASSEENWVYFDFSRGGVVDIQDKTSLEWDLAFRRSKVISNGGATNKIGEAGLINLGSLNFDQVVEVPRDNYIQDMATRTETENPILLKWYRYNYLTHKLSAKPNTYAVKTANSKYVKVKFLGFYCVNKETGCIKMQYVYQDNGSNQFTKSSSG